MSHSKAYGNNSRSFSCTSSLFCSSVSAATPLSDAKMSPNVPDPDPESCLFSASLVSLASAFSSSVAADLVLAGVANGLAVAAHPPNALLIGLRGDAVEVELAAPPKTDVSCLAGANEDADDEAAGWLPKADPVLAAANGEADEAKEPKVGRGFLATGEEAAGVAASGADAGTDGASVAVSVGVALRLVLAFAAAAGWRATTSQHALA